MNTLLFGFLVVFTVSCNAGIVNQAIISGPSGIVTGAGPIGPKELGLGLAHGAATSDAGYGYGGRLGVGVGHGTAITNGGGIVSVSGHGALVKGPNTVPVVISGPAGKIAADGLYGIPTHEHY